MIETRDSSFPEHRFPCAAERRDAYESAVSLGAARMRERTVVLCGLARDVEATLPRTAARIERLGGMFRDYRVIVFENDSRDGTLERLIDWQATNPRVSVLHETFRRPRWPQVVSLERAAEMASYRNRYLETALARFGNRDFLVVLDTDLPDGFSYEGIANTFGHDGWDMVGSNGIQMRTLPTGESFVVQFDSWAFRETGAPGPHGLRGTAARWWRRGEPLVPLDSCFGGLAIYRMEALRAGARYAGTDCEHVPLHRRMRELGFGRVFLNPSQIVIYPTAAAESARPWWRPLPLEEGGFVPEGVRPDPAPTLGPGRAGADCRR
jgi:hypothetical protein